MEEQILNNIPIRDGRSGTTIVKLQVTTGIDFPSLRAVLNKLYKEGKIDVRKGLNNKIIYKNEKERKN